MSGNSTKTYQIATKENCCISVTLSAPIIHAENLYLQTWGSSFVLANLLHKLEYLPFDPKVLSENAESSNSVGILELGAGTGLVGLSAAKIFHPKGKVILTDLPTIIPGLVQNIELNRGLIDGTNPESKVVCGTLDWNSPNELVLHSTTSEHAPTLFPGNEENKALLIVAADTMYTEDHPRLLSQTIFTWLRKTSNARALICYPMRIAYLDAMREFWELMEVGGLACVKEGREELGKGMMGKEKEEWDDEKLHEWCVWKWK